MDDRYSRQISLPQIGPEGQQKLGTGSVIVVGAGGLGSPALTYLVAAGVGRVGIVDADTVSRSNLNRQFLYGDADVGRPKAVAARERLAELNSDVEIVVYESLLTDDNAETLFAGYNLVLGAVDSFDTRAVINRAAVALRIPYVDGGVNGFNGCVMLSHPPQTPCLNCVFPNSSPKKRPTGVLGAIAGVVGAMEANLALLWLLGQHDAAQHRLFLYDGLRMRIDHIEIKHDKGCTVCAGGAI